MSPATFNPHEPIGYFLTWTTYGTWLPGDRRSWKRKGDGQRRRPAWLIELAAANRLRERPFVMMPANRQIVEQTIAQHCAIRRWMLHAVNARSNHVHVVLSAKSVPAKRVREQLKAWSSRLLLANGSIREKFWTEGGSFRMLNTEDDLAAAVEYVLFAQDRKDSDCRRSPEEPSRHEKWTTGACYGRW